jgi:hypothetical protein
MPKECDQLERVTRALGHAAAARLALPRIDFDERRAIVPREWPVQ